MDLSWISRVNVTLIISPLVHGDEATQLDCAYVRMTWRLSQRFEYDEIDGGQLDATACRCGTKCY